jgi:hypothetical protein
LESLLGEKKERDDTKKSDKSCDQKTVIDRLDEYLLLHSGHE